GHPITADDQRPFAFEFAAYGCQGELHRLAVLRLSVRKIGQRLIRKLRHHSQTVSNALSMTDRYTRGHIHAAPPQCRTPWRALGSFVPGDACGTGRRSPAQRSWAQVARYGSAAAADLSSAQLAGGAC